MPVKRTVITAVLVLLFIACATKKSSLVKYKTIDLEEKIPLIEGDPDSIHYHIEFHFTELIEYPDKKVLEQVNTELNKEFFDIEQTKLSLKPEDNFRMMIKSLTESYREEGIELKKEYSEMSYMLNYELIKNSGIVYNKNEVLSLELETYIYSGGAHGIGNKSFLHFNMRNGKNFTFKDIFFDGAKEEITMLLQKKCEEMKKDENSMLFEDAMPEANECFYFNDENIIFVYNPYEIAPYVAGYIAIEIPLENLEKWIDKKGPLGFLKRK